MRRFSMTASSDSASGAGGRGKRRAWRRRLAFAALAALALVLAAGVFCALSWALIDFDEEKALHYPGGTVLCDSAGEILRVTLGEGDVDCRPSYVASRDDLVVKALVAVEDGTFWEHCGVRPLSIARAFFQNIFYRRRISGASTLTMQAARLIEPHKKSYFQKWVEAIKALKMERRHSKEWILSQYLNRAPFGSNFVGIEAAARGWFAKGAKELGPGEAAFLAGMVQAPSRFRPDRGYAAAFKRRDYVLDRMVACGYIDEVERAAARSVAPVISRARRPFRHPYYCDWYMRSSGLAACKGGAPAEPVQTPLEPDLQEVCRAAIDSAASAGGYSVAAVVARTDSRDPLDAIIALTCSGDYFDRSGGQVNTALAPRPAGSTLKPFLAALALDLAIATPEERLDDVRKAYKGYRPANFDSKTRGKVSLRDSLVLSLNLPFLQLLERVGTKRFGNLLSALGFASAGAKDADFGLGMAIGNVEVTLVELVGAYAKLARAAAGTESGAEAEGGLSRGAAYLISEMLSGAERSGAALGHVADVTSARFAWKTGTSAAYRDAWCVLWNPQYVIGVWAGHKRGGFGDKSLVGAQAAAPVAWRIARSLYPSGAGPWFAPPGEELVPVKVCAVSGKAPSPHCAEVVDGVFLRGRTLYTPCRECAMGAKAQKRLEIIKPEDGAQFILVEGMPQQKIVCAAEGAGRDERVWWFLDGVPAGSSTGSAPFALEPAEGEHSILCAAQDGRSAAIKISVRSAAGAAAH